MNARRFAALGLLAVCAGAQAAPTGSDCAGAFRTAGTKDVAAFEAYQASWRSEGALRGMDTMAAGFDMSSIDFAEVRPPLKNLDKMDLSGFDREALEKIGPGVESALRELDGLGARARRAKSELKVQAAASKNSAWAHDSKEALERKIAKLERLGEGVEKARSIWLDQLNFLRCVAK
jgi:hypothetical protein